MVPIILCECACGATAFVFASTVYFVSWLRWHPLCFWWATSRKKLQISRIVNWVCIPRHIRSLIRACAGCKSKILPFFASFCKNYVLRLHMLIWFFKCNNWFFCAMAQLASGCSSTHVQIVHTCIPGTSNGKTYTLHTFYYKWYARKSIYIYHITSLLFSG